MTMIVIRCIAANAYSSLGNNNIMMTLLCATIIGDSGIATTYGGRIWL